MRKGYPFLLHLNLIHKNYFIFTIRHDQIYTLNIYIRVYVVVDDVCVEAFLYSQMNVSEHWWISLIYAHTIQMIHCILFWWSLKWVVILPKIFQPGFCVYVCNTYLIKIMYVITWSISIVAKFGIFHYFILHNICIGILYVPYTLLCGDFESIDESKDACINRWMFVICVRHTCLVLTAYLYCHCKPYNVNIEFGNGDATYVCQWSESSNFHAQAHTNILYTKHIVPLC